MSIKGCFTALPVQININGIKPKEPSPEFIDERQEGLESFLILMAVFDSVPYLLLTALLFMTFPLLAPVGIIRILFLINQCLMNFQKLE